MGYIYTIINYRKSYTVSGGVYVCVVSGVWWGREGEGAGRYTPLQLQCVSADRARGRAGRAGWTVCI